MNNIVAQNILRFVGLLLLQVLILKRMQLGGDIAQYFHIFLYPLAIMLLPIRTPVPVVLSVSFALGIFVDMFYDSPGVHASACVFMGYIRPIALGIMEPRDGYNVNYSPTKKTLGIGWFAQYAAIMLTAFLFFYFSVEAFTFVYLGSILLKTIISFIASGVFVLIFMAILDPDQ